MEQFLRVISSVLEKIPGKVILLWVCLTTGALLLVPDSWITTLRLTDFLNEYGIFVGIVFLASAVLLVIQIAIWLWELMQRSRKKATAKKALRSAISTLDEHEKSVLREFYLQDKDIVWLPTDDSVVAGLLEKDIISLVGESGRLSKAGMLFPVSLPPLVKPDDVGFPLGEATKEQIEQVRNSRPPFMQDIENTPDWPWWIPPPPSRYHRAFG